MSQNPFDPGYYNENELRQFGFKSVGENVQVAKNCTIIGLENIIIGHHVRIDGYTTLVAVNQGYLHIGSYVHIGGYSAIFAGAGVVLSDFSGLSQGVKLYTTSDNYDGSVMTNPTVPAKYTGVIRAPILIERHTIIGSQSIIMPGVTVAEGCAVGANSFITKNTEAWSVYFGSPARRLKARKRTLLESEQQFLNNL
ncbi:TPA: acyltransferase [Citrobacter koseri]|uniref:acyltransferase n=1 Tax=Citrobacter TaxID=544 RepID=UPI001A2F1541|nr:DapH/DapD/GlmU-related protein [Citrobacter sp. CK189]MDM3017218.1 acyltransferase [Citrobacter sp. CK189]HAU5602559.1 acyltransferase [Citrobacter koseri]HBC7342542.1 acyltransferase [Citrobacter koseri]HDQ2604470.1 acyltransferase [Citrobacter koseri]